MAWTSNFIAALSKQSQQRSFLLETVALWNEPGVVGYSTGSDAGIGSDRTVGITRITFEGQSVTPQSWTSTVGAFDVYVAGDPTELFGNITRGSTIQIRMGWAGWAGSDFEPVALGRVQRITRSGGSPEWCITCLDAYSAASQRLDNAHEIGLFYDLPTSTTLTASSAVADGTYDVVAADAWEKSTDWNGLALVTSALGDPYYRRWSGAHTTTLTIQSAGTALLMGTTDVGASSGDVIAQVAYMEGHPISIARSVLTSRGSAANGTYDDLPVSWGLGIGQEFFDDVDIDNVLRIVQPASGSFFIQVGVTDQVTDPRAWLQDTLLAPFGLFLAMRQGLLTIRAAQDPTTGTTASTYSSGFEISVDDVIAVEEWHAFDPDVETEYAGVAGVTYGPVTTLGTSQTPATMPGAQIVTIDVSDSVFSNGAAVMTEMIARLGLYYTRIPEVIRMRTTLRAAQLAVGDLITVTLGAPFVWSRRDGALGYSGRRALVTQVNADFWGGTCRVDIRVYPDAEDWS